MPRRPPRPLPTIWRVPDDLWRVVARVLAELDPPKRTGCRRIDPGRALDAIIFRLRSGCQWNRLPKEFPDDSSVHRTFQRWVRPGVFERPEPEERYPQHLCPDKGYDNDTGWGAIVDYVYEPHIQLIRDLRPPREERHKPRRWVVERTLAWLCKCRAILVRWDKKACNYLGLLKLACVLLWFRRYHRLVRHPVCHSG